MLLVASSSFGEPESPGALRYSLLSSQTPAIQFFLGHHTLHRRCTSTVRAFSSMLSHLRV
ncbi:hypothetical protein [Pseudomonas phage phiZ98]|nr:hypothetical protein [Pseudomonas phage phiZ98]